MQCIPALLLLHPNCNASCAFLQDSLVTNNTAGRYGGGLCRNASTSPLLRGQFVSNRAQQAGGGVAQFDSEGALTQVSFSANTAPTGAAVYSFNSSSVVPAELGLGGGQLAADVVTVGASLGPAPAVAAPAPAVANPETAAG